MIAAYLQNKYGYNIHVKLWVLLLSLFLLWFSSSDEFFLGLNIKLVGCSVRYFIYCVKYWKNQMMFMTLIIGNFLLIIIPSSFLISISLQTALLLVSIQFAEHSLYWLFHGRMISRFKENGDALLPFLMGNYFFKNQCLSLYCRTGIFLTHQKL